MYNACMHSCITTCHEDVTNTSQLYDCSCALSAAIVKVCLQADSCSDCALEKVRLQNMGCIPSDHKPFAGVVDCGCRT